MSLDQFGHIGSTLIASKRGALPHTTGDQLKGPRRKFMTCRGDTNHTRDSPTSMSTFQGGTHDIRVTSTVERIVHTPFSQVASNMLLYWLVQGRTIHTIRRTQGNGGSEFVWIDVNCNDTIGPYQFSTLNNC
jgi:hypothetical protein